MEFLQIKYFVSLARSEHLTNTAKEFFVSPSAVSASLLRLEEELGCKLFDRVGRGIQLNSNGKLFLGYAESILFNVETAQSVFARMNGTGTETLSVGLWHPRLFKEPLDQFRARYPDLVFRYVYFDPVITRNSPENSCDAIIAPIGSFSDENWFTEIFFHDRILLAVPPEHRLAHREVVSLEEVKDENFVFSQDGSFSRHCKALCEQAGFTPKVHLECEYTERAGIIRSENAIGLTTYSAFLGGLFSDVPLIQLDNHPARYQAIHWPKWKKRSPHTELLIKHLQEYYSAYDASLPCSPRPSPTAPDRL